LIVSRSDRASPSAGRVGEGEVELGDVDPRLAEETEQSALGVGVDEGLDMPGR
jgi:hypothetical protein